MLTLLLIHLVMAGFFLGYMVVSLLFFIFLGNDQLEVEALDSKIDKNFIIQCLLWPLYVFKMVKDYNVKNKFVKAYVLITNKSTENLLILREIGKNIIK